MKREIKFRGWSEQQNKWIYGGYHKPFEDVTQIIEITSSNASQMSLIKSGTESQFTGLKDKKGIDIYENDKTKDNYTVLWCEEKAMFAEFFYDHYSKKHIIAKYPINSKDIELL